MAPSPNELLTSHVLTSALMPPVAGCVCVTRVCFMGVLVSETEYSFIKFAPTLCVFIYTRVCVLELPWTLYVCVTLI